MRREMDVIRDIALAVSAAPASVSALDGLSNEIFAFHAQLMEEAGLVQAALLPDGKRVATTALIFRLTWTGHEFADSVRDPKIWAETKKGAEAAGGFTIDLLKDLARGFLKKQIEELTGVKL